MHTQKTNTHLISQTDTLLKSIYSVLSIEEPDTASLETLSSHMYRTTLTSGMKLTVNSTLNMQASTIGIKISDEHAHNVAYISIRLDAFGNLSHYSIDTHVLRYPGQLLQTTQYKELVRILSLLQECFSTLNYKNTPSPDTSA